MSWVQLKPPSPTPEVIKDIHEWRRCYPVQRNQATGRWGWRRQDGDFQPAYANHRTPALAGFDRDAAFARFQRGETV